MIIRRWVAVAMIVLLAASSLAVEAQGNGKGNDKSSNGEGNGKGNDKSDADEKGSKSQGKGPDKESKGKSADKRQDKGPQGMALGSDTQWHECRSSASGSDKKACHSEAQVRAQERFDAIKAARHNGTLGGEVNVTENGTVINGTDAVNITVETVGNSTEPTDNQTDNFTLPDLKVTVGANLERGQTFSFDIEASYAEGGAFSIQYYDVDENGTETLGNITQADSFEDVMDPDDDDGPEYWIVEEPDGVHLLVSIDSWSVHVLTFGAASLAAASAAQTQPESGGVDAPGLAVAATLAVAAAALTLAMVALVVGNGRKDD